MRRLLVLLAALGVVAGCSTSIPGTPSPEAAPAGVSPSATGLNLPPRPRDLKLDGLDACASLTAAQLAKLDLKIFSPSVPTDPIGFTGNLCTASGFDSRKASVSIAFATNRGIQVVANSPDAVTYGVEPAQIAGFPGTLIAQPQKNSCVADIDAAPGQLIDITYTDNATAPALSKEQLCQGATTVGEEVISSLLTT
jgi:hypothetical protein